MQSCPPVCNLPKYAKHLFMCAMSLARVYTTVSLGTKSSLQLQHQIIHRPLHAQEKPQVVDEVAVPSIPTGIDKAQLLRVNAARCCRQRAMCLKRGKRGRARRLPRHSHLVPTWHMFLEHPLIFAPYSLSESFRKEGASLISSPTFFSKSLANPMRSWRPLPDMLVANTETEKIQGWRIAIV